MTNKELFYFTGKCLMLDENPLFREEIIALNALGTIDWLRFSATCSDHLILPVIYLKFQKQGLLDYLPEEFSDHLKYIYDLNRERNTRILVQLHSITTILNKNDICPVFLKGSAHLLDGLYSDIGERIMGDIDFLIPEKDYHRTAKIFEDEGYGLYEPFLYFDVAVLKHYPPLVKSGEPAYLEIHRLLSPKELSWFNARIIDQEKKEIKTLQGCYVLSDKHKIAHNFIHGQLHHQGHLNGIVSFRDLYDLYLLSKRSDIHQTLAFIKAKRKAIAYFVFAGKAFGTQGRFYAGNSLSARIFVKKHDLNLSSRTFYHTYRTIVFLGQRIVFKYIPQLVKSFYSREVRQSLIKRMKDPNYYRAHFKSYIDFFAQKK
ncbi:MAG TPA: nucleotidyltransferase family protein [Anaerovoracaceae bacterium]|nr:nucleotidyltransferase family protein [Anaerovoracaceae bacterium]